MTAYARRRRGQQVRLLALVVAALIAALLLGLSAARNALPGDTFKLIPRSPVTETAVGSGADQSAQNRTGGYEYPDDRDVSTEMPAWVPRVGEPAPTLLATVPVALIALTVVGLACRERTCRAPPGPDLLRPALG